MTNTQRDAARAKAGELLARMRTDPEFIQQLRADPRATLAAAGMPADVVDEAVDSLGLGPEEAIGHARATSRNNYGPLPARLETIWMDAQDEDGGSPQ